MRTFDLFFISPFLHIFSFWQIVLIDFSKIVKDYVYYLKVSISSSVTSKSTQFVLSFFELYCFFFVQKVSHFRIMFFNCIFCVLLFLFLFSKSLVTLKHQFLQKFKIIMKKFILLFKFWYLFLYLSYIFDIFLFFYISYIFLLIFIINFYFS